MEEPSHQLLAIKNWDKFQVKPARGGPCRDWIRLDTNLEDDRDYCLLSDFQRYILIGIWRLRGRMGKDVPNDPSHIGRALNVEGTNRPRLGYAIHTLIERGFLIPYNQQKLPYVRTYEHTDIPAAAGKFVKF